MCNTKHISANFIPNYNRIIYGRRFKGYVLFIL